jgi:hypothetical protein
MDTVLEWLFPGKWGGLTGVENWSPDLLTTHEPLFVVIAFVMAAVYAALIFLVVYSYRREGEAPARAKAMLAAIRIAVITLIFLVLLRPALVFHWSSPVYDSVVVLIDDSNSMSFKDDYADPNLGSDPNKPSPSAAKLAGFLHSRPGQLNTFSRMGIVRTSLTDANGVLKRLASDHRLVFLRYPSTQPSRAVDEIGDTGDPVLAGGAREPGPGYEKLLKVLADSNGLASTGQETNIVEGLRGGLRAVLPKLRNQEVTGLIHIGDGQVAVEQPTGPLSSAWEGARDSERTIPRFAVMVGDPTPPKTIRVVELQAPPKVRAGMPVEFSTTLSHRHMERQRVTLELYRRDANQPAEQGKLVNTWDVDLTDGDAAEGAQTKGVQRVTWQQDVGEAGAFTYRLQIKPLPNVRGPDEGGKEVNVAVSEGFVKLLLISGDSGKEYQFFTNLLLRDPNSYRVSIWLQNLEPNMTQLGTELRDSKTGVTVSMRIKDLPHTKKELLGGDPNDPNAIGYDAVILYDPEPTEGGFDKKFMQLLDEYVKVHGRGLCYIGSNKHSESALLKTEGHELLSDLLPVVLAPNTLDITDRIGDRPPEAWPVQLTSYGDEHPLMRLEPTQRESGDVWAVLPGLYWSHAVMRVKPGASILAVNSNPLRRTERNEREPLIAVQTVGKGGRVLYIGSDETWRWRSLRDATFYQRFWSNVVTYLTAVERQRITITAGGEKFSPRGPITLEVEAYDRNYEALKDPNFNLEAVEDSNQVRRMITLKAVPGKPGRYAWTLAGKEMLPLGRYTLKPADLTVDDGVARKRIEIAAPAVEYARTEADPRTLETIASRKENFLQIYDIGRLADLIPFKPATVPSKDQRELWDSLLTLLLIVLLLAIEWALRKKYNMA